MAISGGTILGIFIVIVVLMVMLCLTVEIITHIGGRKNRRDKRNADARTDFSEEIEEA